jgi:hypothetical protein
MRNAKNISEHRAREVITRMPIATTDRLCTFFCHDSGTPETGRPSMLAAVAAELTTDITFSPDFISGRNFTAVLDGVLMTIGYASDFASGTTGKPVYSSIKSVQGSHM